MTCHSFSGHEKGALAGGVAGFGEETFVNEAFRAARDRFGPRRKDGARKMRGGAAAWSGKLWSLRDLRVETG